MTREDICKEAKNWGCDKESVNRLRLAESDEAALRMFKTIQTSEMTRIRTAALELFYPKEALDKIDMASTLHEAERVLATCRTR